MNLIQNNPYRIAGILANSSERELQKQKSKISKFASIGREATSEYDFSFLDKVDRNPDNLKIAFSALEQNQGKVRNALFWFLNATPFDNTALEYLKSGDKDKATEIWEKVTENKAVNAKNFSCFNNISTINLLSDDLLLKQKGIAAKIKLVKSDNFKYFVHAVADETYTIENEKQAKKLIDDLLVQLNGKISNTEILNLFSKLDDANRNYISEKFTETPLQKIETRIENCKRNRKANSANAYDFGLKLNSNTKDDLSLLKSLLGTSDIKYQFVADQLANEILQCGIDHFNESQKNDSNEDSLESAKKLIQLANSIAVGRIAKDRVKDSLTTLADMKDRKINQAIAKLNSILLAYDKAIGEIDSQVSAMLANMPYNQTINYSKVDQMKTNCLNWDKVVEFISNGISKNDVEAIQRCSNQSKVKVYKDLVEFLLDKLGPIQINQLKYLCYWKDIRAIQVKSTAKKVSTTVSTAGGGCYIATMAYGDYEHPQVLELRKFRDDILSKSILGRNFIKLYYNYSPSLVEKLKNKQGVNLIIRKILDQFIKTIR